jgi:hypothetical protein
VAPATVAPGTLVALHGARGETVALGVVESVDADGMLTVRAACEAADVVALTVGETMAA